MVAQNIITNSINSVVNQSDISEAPARIVQAIKTAAAQTGVDFSYLMNKAAQESSFDPNAKASTSSATGLFQFTSQTWLSMVKQYGADYGLGNYASQITADASGHLSVSDPVARHAILALRKDPQVSAEMAGELDKQNAAALQRNVGGKIGGTELYLAHFLGATGANNFISELRANPTAAAASVLPEAAAANPSVFYDKSGAPRSLQQIYQHFAQKFDSNTTQIASASPVSTQTSSYRVASSAPIAVNLAKLSSRATGTNYISRISAGMNVASNGSSSTLFNTMVLGQMNGAGDISPLGALNQMDNRKKNAYAALSAVG